jgi:hypothetical protein
MRKMFQKIVRFTKTLLPFFFPHPTLPFYIDKKNKKDSEFVKFKQDLIDTLLLISIFLSPFVAVALLILGLAICVAR